MTEFQKTIYYQNEDSYEYITDLFADLRDMGYIEQHVDIQDIYLNKGNFVAVQHYDNDPWKEEGHGIHSFNSYTPLEYGSVKICTEEEVKVKLHQIEYPDAYQHVNTH